jgi:putative endonuclease
MFYAFAYIVRCRDGSYYVGSARGDLDKRIAEHNAGTYGGYTSRRRPVELVWSCEFQQITDAISAERQIKVGAGPRRKLSYAVTKTHSFFLRGAARHSASRDEINWHDAAPIPCVLRDGRFAASSG